MNKIPNFLIKSLKWLTHPIVVFVSLQVVWIAFVILWIVWFINQQETLVKLSEAIGSGKITPTTGLMTLIIGSVLLGIILVGTIVLFVFTQTQGSLLRQQKSFVSSVTHELRSPLSSIQLSFETIQRPNLPLDIRDKLIKMIRNDIDRLTHLVDRILISSRLDRGLVDFTSHLEIFSFMELVEKTIEQTKHLDHELEKRLKIHGNTDLKLYTNRLALQLTMGNLIENAVKYSPQSSTIELSVERHDHEVLISVNDQGIGLQGRDRSKVFNLFHRSPGASKKAVPGTGIGLYIVRSMVKGLGGRVWAESPGIGKGATFFVCFPEQILASKHSSVNEVQPTMSAE